jgi:hypothetical protein
MKNQMRKRTAPTPRLMAASSTLFVASVDDRGRVHKMSKLMQPQITAGSQAKRTNHAMTRMRNVAKASYPDDIFLKLFLSITF